MVLVLALPPAPVAMPPVPPAGPLPVVVFPPAPVAMPPVPLARPLPLPVVVFPPAPALPREGVPPHPGKSGSETPAPTSTVHAERTTARRTTPTRERLTPSSFVSSGNLEGPFTAAVST